MKNYNISSKINTYPRNVHIFMKKWKKLPKSVKITKINCKMVKSAIFHEIYFIFWKFNNFMKIWIEIMWNPANERFSCHYSFPNKVKVICITVFLKSYFQNGVNFQFFKKTGVKLGYFSKSSVGFSFHFQDLNFYKWLILTLLYTIVFIY